VTPEPSSGQVTAETPVSAPVSGPLNPAQQAIWMHQLVAGEPTLYLEHTCHDLRGDLDEARLVAALRRALAAHPVFGAEIRVERGVPSLVLGVHDIAVEQVTSTPDGLAALLDRESFTLPTGATLVGGPLTRCLLVTVSPTHRVLLLVWHHLLADATALRLFRDTLSACWDGRDPDPLPVTVCDANAQQLAAAASPTGRQRALAAADRVRGLDPQPLGPATGGAAESRCRVITHTAGGVPGLWRAATALRVTPPMLLAAAYQRAVGEVLGLSEFLYGVVLAGRSVPASERVVGCFVNTALLRGDGDPATPARDLVRRSGRALVTALAEQDVPFGAVAAHLLRDLRPRPKGFPQLYLSMDVNHPLHLSGVDGEQRRIYHAQAKFDVALVVEHAADGVRGALHHRTSVLAEDRADQLVTAFLAHLRGLVADA
jgi:hypothetical protein